MTVGRVLWRVVRSVFGDVTEMLAAVILLTGMLWITTRPFSGPLTFWLSSAAYLALVIGGYVLFVRWRRGREPETARESMPAE
jgi:hypothetical protein